ncbi:MAG: hypothetical protein QHJ73_12570, partial [Armatimonadota bacterium]|nr:hypothetical protein [Armatimonadota bacterium]
MRTYSTFCRAVWALLTGFSISAPCAARKGPEPPSPSPPGASGVFVDRDGARHEWRVNAAFAMVWEGQPYLPLGVRFPAESLRRPADAAAWEEDQERLKALKASGVADVLVRPAGDVAAPPAEAWQRLVDALEANGFRYGVSLPGPSLPGAAGYFVNAGFFRSPPLSPNGETTLELRIPGFDGEYQRVACAVLDTHTGRLARVEWARLEKIPGGVRASLRTTVAPAAEHVAEMVPLVAGVPGLPDFWSDPEGAHDYLNELAKVKWGPGLRFFTHPYAEAVRLEGPAAFVIPVAGNYRLEFEAYLNRTYRTPGALRSRWAFRGALPPSVEAAARLTPLTVAETPQGRVGYLLDEKELRCYVIDPRESTFWSDHLYFREHSIRQYLQLTSQIIRRRLADVPVVVPRSGNVRHYHFSDETPGGMAGVGLSAAVRSVVEEGGRAAGEARLAAIRPWCVALSVGGFTGSDDLRAALEALRRLGVKGWFLDPQDTPPSEAGAWIAACRPALTNPAENAEYLPRYVLYPRALPETGAFGGSRAVVQAATRPLAEHVWWVPTIASWQALDLGPDIAGYSLLGPEGGIYVWSREGKRRITVRPLVFGPVEVRESAGKGVRRLEGGRRFTIDLTEAPVVVIGVPPEQFIPVELAAAELAEM